MHFVTENINNICWIVLSLPLSISTFKINVSMWYLSRSIQVQKWACSRANIYAIKMNIKCGKMNEYIIWFECQSILSWIQGLFPNMSNFLLLSISSNIKLILHFMNYNKKFANKKWTFTLSTCRFTERVSRASSFNASSIRLCEKWMLDIKINWFSSIDCFNLFTILIYVTTI